MDHILCRRLCASFFIICLNLTSICGRILFNLHLCNLHSIINGSLEEGRQLFTRSTQDKARSHGLKMRGRQIHGQHLGKSSYPFRISSIVKQVTSRELLGNSLEILKGKQGRKTDLGECFRLRTSCFRAGILLL